MKRNKKNTFINAGEAEVKKSRSGDADAGGRMIALTTYGSEQKMPAETNGPKGPEPTRYGDWEQKGRCTDF